MSVPPELMKLIAGGAGKGGMPSQAPGMPHAGGAAAGGAPMSTPQPAQGDKQSAMVNVSIAMDLLEQTLPALGSESEEGKTILQCLTGLSKKFGHTRSKSNELVPAELMQLMASLPHGGAPGGAPPGGMPPGMPPQPMPQAA